MKKVEKGILADIRLTGGESLVRNGVVRLVEMIHGVEDVDAAIDAGFERIKINMVISEETGPEELTEMENFCRGRGLILQKIRQYSLMEDKLDHETPASSVSFDRPLSCALCDRIRLTCDGYLKPCLLSNREIKVNPEDTGASLREAIWAEPPRGEVCGNRNMVEIGG